MQSLLHIPRSLIFWKLFKNIWLQRKRKKDMEEKKKMEKKEHLEKKNIFFCRGIEKQRRKIFRPQRRRRTETEKEDNLLEKENVTMCDRRTDIVKIELELWRCNLAVSLHSGPHLCSQSPNTVHPHPSPSQVPRLVGGLGFTLPSAWTRTSKRLDKEPKKTLSG